MIWLSLWAISDAITTSMKFHQRVPLAQRIARWTSNPKVLGSIPRWDGYLKLCQWDFHRKDFMNPFQQASFLGVGVITCALHAQFCCMKRYPCTHLLLFCCWLASDRNKLVFVGTLYSCTLRPGLPFVCFSCPLVSEGLLSVYVLALVTSLLMLISSSLVFQHLSCLIDQAY